MMKWKDFLRDYNHDVKLNRKGVSPLKILVYIF